MRLILVYFGCDLGTNDGCKNGSDVSNETKVQERPSGKVASSQHTIYGPSRKTNTLRTQFLVALYILVCPL